MRVLDFGLRRELKEKPSLWETISCEELMVHYRIMVRIFGGSYLRMW